MPLPQNFIHVWEQSSARSFLLNTFLLPDLLAFQKKEKKRSDTNNELINLKKKNASAQKNEKNEIEESPLRGNKR